MPPLAPHGLARLGVLLGVTVLAGSCAENATAPIDPGELSLTIISGNGQSGVVGTELAGPLGVLATNAQGPVAGLTVEFDVIQGGGSMRVAATSTDANGAAQNYWTLGTSTVEPQEVVVRAVATGGTSKDFGTFTATPLAGPATTIAILRGNDQTADASTPVAIQPAVLVTDQFGNPVPNESVVFEVPPGGGGGSVAGGNRTTGTDGEAEVLSWTLGPTPGQVNLLEVAPVNPAITPQLLTFSAFVGNFWTARAPVPTARRGLAAGVVGGVLYTAGGLDGNGDTGVVEAYDPATDTWTSRAPMPTPRRFPGAAVVGGVLYVVGGFNTTGVLGTLEAYDPATNTWTQRAPMPTARSGPRAGVVNGVLYAVGGWDGDTVVSRVEAYDPVTDTWSQRAPMPTPRAAPAVAVVGGVLYAVAGEGLGGQFVGVVEAYDPGTDMWSQRAGVQPRRSLAAEVVGGVLHVMGGWDGTTALNTLEAYDPTTNTWTLRAPMLAPREQMAAAVVDGLLYVVGGVDVNGQITGGMEAYSP